MWGVQCPAFLGGVSRGRHTFDPAIPRGAPGSPGNPDMGSVTPPPPPSNLPPRGGRLLKTNTSPGGVRVRMIGGITNPMSRLYQCLGCTRDPAETRVYLGLLQSAMPGAFKLVSYGKLGDY
jgi:hypothetical protein